MLGFSGMHPGRVNRECSLGSSSSASHPFGGAALRLTTVSEKSQQARSLPETGLLHILNNFGILGGAVRENPTREEMYEELKALEGDEMTFTIHRSYRDQVTTVSREAMEAALDHVRIFTGARIMAFHERTGTMPQDIGITVSMQFDDKVDRTLAPASGNPGPSHSDGFHRPNVPTNTPTTNHDERRDI